MMDYDPARIELFPDKANVEDRYLDVNYETLTKSIEKDNGFSDVEYQVRQYFEVFLTSLSRLNYFTDAGSIHPEELCADFGYHINLMSGAAREIKLKNTGIDIEPFAKAVRGFLDRWQIGPPPDAAGRPHRL